MIRPNTPPKLEVLEVYSTHPAIQVKDVVRNVGIGEASIELIFDPCRRISPSVRAVVVVRTDSKMEPIHCVPVRVVSNESD